MNKEELAAYAMEKFGVKLDMRKSVKKLQTQVNELATEPVADVQNSKPEVQKDPVDKIVEMNAVARKIWQNQSVSLPMVVRVGRIILALKDKGYLKEDRMKLSLPTEVDIHKFLC